MSDVNVQSCEHAVFALCIDTSISNSFEQLYLG